MPIISNFPSGNVKKDELIIPEGLPEIGREGGLEAYTWAEISAISAANLGDKYFGLGETKSVLVNGTVGTMPINQTLYVFILGFNHNREIEGDGITFGCFKQSADDENIFVLTDSKYMQSVLGISSERYFTLDHALQSRQAGIGWYGSDLRYDILGSTNAPPSNYLQAASKSGLPAPANTPLSPIQNTLMAALPLELRQVLKPIKKIWPVATYHSQAWDRRWFLQDGLDYISLLSLQEILHIDDAEYAVGFSVQKQYDYFKILNLNRYGNNWAENHIFYTTQGSGATILLRSEGENDSYSSLPVIKTPEYYRWAADPHTSCGLFTMFKI